MDALAMVIYGDRELFLGGLLADYVLVQKLLNFQWLRDLVGSSRGGFDFIVLEDRVTHRDTLITNVGAGIVARRRDELSDYVLALMTKGTSQSIIGSGTLHAVFSSSALGSEDEPPG
jgi:hypothetical protein